MIKIVIAVFVATISWTHPAFPSDSGVIDGQEIFLKKCAPCHYTTGKRKVGPGLAGISKKITRKWAREWIADPQGTWERNNGYTRVLRKNVRDGEKRKKTLMQFQVVKGSLIPEEVDAVIDYMETL